MRCELSKLSRYLAFGLGLGLLLWGAGCQQHPAQAPAQQPGAAGGAGAAPTAEQEKQEEQMSNEQGAAGDVATPLGKDGSVTGTQNYTELAALDITISNGTLTVRRGADLAPGEVRLSWTVRPGSGLRKANPRDVVITQSVKEGLLAVADEFKGAKGLSSPEIDMLATVGSDIAAAASLGNGTLDVDCARIKAADCGNGTLKLAGALLGDADVSLGNGKLVAVLQISGGSHDLSVGNGQIDLTAQAGSAFSFTADTGVGSVKVSGANARETGRDWGMVGGEVRGTVGAGAGGNGSAPAGGKVALSVGNGAVSVTGE